MGGKGGREGEQDPARGWVGRGEEDPARGWVGGGRRRRRRRKETALSERVRGDYRFFGPAAVREMDGYGNDGIRPCLFLPSDGKFCGVARIAARLL